MNGTLNITGVLNNVFRIEQVCKDWVRFGSDIVLTNGSSQTVATVMSVTDDKIIVKTEDCNIQPLFVNGDMSDHIMNAVLYGCYVNGKLFQILIYEWRD